MAIEERGLRVTTDGEGDYEQSFVRVSVCTSCGCYVDPELHGDPCPFFPTDEDQALSPDSERAMGRIEEVTRQRLGEDRSDE